MKNLEPIDWRLFSPAPVIGVDEVGRGCLVGSVYAAAVIFNSSELSANLKGQLTDSKLVSEKRRNDLAAFILSEHKVGIGFATAAEIDSLNILKASLLAMKRAVEKLQVTSGHLLVDGNQRIPGLSGFQQTTVVKGDLRVEVISAASIVAKVARDQVMKDLGEKYPEYGFEKHKGYSTLQHKEAIAKYGPCFEHRRTFAGVKEHLSTARGLDL